MVFIPRKGAKKTKLRKSKAPAAKLVRAVAKKVVSDALEDKYARAEPQSGGQPVLFNSTITLFTEFYPLLPTITQGVDSYQRVGDKIRPKSLIVDVQMAMNGALSTAMMNRVRLFLMESKGVRDFSLRDQIQPTQLLDFGNTVGAFTGLPNQTLVRVNRRAFKVFHDKLYVMSKGVGTTPQTAGAGGTQTSMSANQVINLRFKIPCPAVLHYNSPLATYPTNFAPFITLGYVQPDGDISPDTAVNKVAMTYSAHLDYEDA